jgi:hypothetical protein
MWSGPRNISTAMMRSFENRADCVVSDEPFYAYYLHRTGIAHPMRAEVIASQPTDWRSVVAGLTANRAARIWFQKHMTLHLLDEVDRDFLAQLTNAFLIRDPVEVAISYHKMRPNPTLADLGFAQQWALYQYVVEVLGQRPVILDARDVLANPEGALRDLCAVIGVPFDPAMLVWPAGGRPSDGVWASHWYTQVYRSTSFEAPSAPPTDVPDCLRAVVDAAHPYYQQMCARRTPLTEQ